MPFALVFHHAHVSVGELDKLRQGLPHAIAGALSVPGTEAALEPSEIEVKMFPFGPFDVSQGYEVAIVIFANDYPERRKIVDAAVKRIGQEARRCLAPNTPGFVWIRLAPAAFYDFGAREGP